MSGASTATATASPPILKLPNMNEFSPGTLDNDIQSLLRLVSGQADADAAKGALIAAYPRLAATTNSRQRMNRAGNVLIGMSQCGLLEKVGNAITTRLTPAGSKILAAPNTETAAERLAAHMLTECYGLDLIDVVETLRARALSPSLENIRDELEVRGFTVTENEGNASKIRQWIEPSGVVDAVWRVNDSRLHQVIGLSSATLGKWHSLPRPQRIFLEKLRDLDAPAPGNWRSVRQIKKIAEVAYGARAFPTGRLRDQVIQPLVAGGWLEARGTGGGRGGDSGEVKAKPQLSDVAVKLPLDEMYRIPADLRSKLSMPLNQIFDDLTSTDINIKGIALELLALNIVRELGLIPVGFRLRSRKSQGAEVDLVAEGIHLHFSRWLIQCKNTPGRNLEVDYIAKEVGMAVVLKAHVVMMVTTGNIGAAVLGYADDLAQNSALQAVLIDGDILAKYRAGAGTPVGATALIDHLQATGRQVMRLKRSQISDKEI